MMALIENPAQRDWLMEDFENRIGPAVEECIRWASPVMPFACFATEDTEINGHPVRAGDKPQVPHFCLGNQLAKAELRNLFRELLTRLSTVEFGEPDLLYSSFVHGVKRLPAFVQ
jgi:cytochrome P450